MGLQRWPPSTAALSSMACLHVETPSICRGKFKSALKTPAAFHERIRSLERARTGNLLKHKLCSRPTRSELVRMHVLQETEAEPSVQATRIRLKRARLADDLNEKIAHRPGPMELVEKNILPVDGGAKEIHEGDNLDLDKTVDVYRFDEDNSDALSTPEPPCRTPPSTMSSAASPTETASSCSNASSSMQHSSPFNATSPGASEQPAVPSQPTVALLAKQGSPKTPHEKSRGKKSREAKPRVRKLKYHQYIPPDQKHELQLAAAQMDSAYVRILQQQQQFLQLQILSQQHFCQQGAPPATHKSMAEVQTGCSGAVLSENCKPDQLPANVDEMKVAELKVELKLRSLPVSGTKTDLIERLKVYHESVVAMETNPPDKLTPPVSPVASKVSSLGLEDSARADSPTKPAGATSPQEDPMSGEKDRRLHEKERQIEELKRKLEQEQRLVEELKLQLEVEKRSQQGDSPPCLSPLPTFHHVKEERLSLSSCTAAVEVKHEEDAERSYLAASSNKDGALPVSIRPPVNGIKMQSGSSAASGLILTSGQVPPKIDESAPLTKFSHCSTSSPPLHHNSHPAFILPQLKCKNLREPPPYEDAVKHTRMATAVQGVSAASQQMDDLFDVLIESGEIPPFIKQDPPSINKRLPVTPCVTLLPVNTVLSRPPPLVQVAHMPPAALAPDPRLDSLLSADAEPLKLMEELHSDLHAMDWLDLTLCAPAEGVDAENVSAPEGVFTTDFLNAHELL
ncbi:myocardin-related transcription factor B isoform X2 [Dunckerocampus dactyliophorus]|uniref:myocardin-related transcription factor B isoform X2 n=1 Tax=Dunckerocampus dactyliophorus TaxID=161453 RepID=UPI002405991E|nr:myocardin-related transcription factor B isoform X2 [Dunckerocampus dactyliophorus]